MDFNFKKFFFNNKESDFQNLPQHEQEKINQAFDTMNKFFDGNLDSQGSPLKVVHLSNQGQGYSHPIGTSKLKKGIFLVILSTILFMLFVFLYPTFSREGYELKADLQRFNPFDALEEIRSHIGQDAKLGSINIKYVRSDGTIDLTAKYKPQVSYIFYRELSNPPENAIPGPSKWYEPIYVTIQKPGWKTYNTGRGGVNFVYIRPMEVSRTPAISDVSLSSDPSCSIVDFWKQALDRGGPSESVAEIMYSTPYYNFSINGSDASIIFKLDCKPVM